MEPLEEEGKASTIKRLLMRTREIFDITVNAGPLANLLACCTVLLYMQTAGQYSYSGYWFACTNLLVGGANLLPLPGLDGAHILHGMFYSLDKRHRI